MHYLLTIFTLFTPKLRLNLPQLMCCTTSVCRERSDELIVDSAFVGHGLSLHVAILNTNSRHLESKR